MLAHTAAMSEEEQTATCAPLTSARKEERRPKFVATASFDHVKHESVAAKQQEIRQFVQILSHHILFSYYKQ